MLSTYQLLRLSRMNDSKEEVLVQNRGNDIDSIDEDDSPFLSVKDSDSSEEADANIEAGNTNKACNIKACNIKACKIEARNVEADDSPFLEDSEADETQVFNPRNTSSESDGNIEAGNDNADNTEADDDSVEKDENSGDDANVEDSFDGIIDGIEEALEASEVLLEELEGSFKESSPVPPQESVLNWTLDDTPVKEDEKPEEDIETDDGIVEDDGTKDDDSTEEDGIRIYYLDDKIDEKDKIEEEEDLEEINEMKEDHKLEEFKAKLNVLRKYKTLSEWREYLDSVWSQ